MRRSAAQLGCLALLALAGCTLVDQTTFDPPRPVPTPPPAPPPPAGPRVDTRTPLLTIGYATADPDFGPSLRTAVRAAEGRGRVTFYDVIAVVSKAAELSLGQARAASVMRAIMAENVPAERLQLGVRVEPTATVAQVRVYVR